MNIKSLLVTSLIGVISIPALTIGSSYVSSLILDKTPEEAVQIIAEQTDILIDRTTTQEETISKVQTDQSNQENIISNFQTIIDNQNQIIANQQTEIQSHQETISQIIQDITPPVIPPDTIAPTVGLERLQRTMNDLGGALYGTGIGVDHPTIYDPDTSGIGNIEYYVDGVLIGSVIYSGGSTPVFVFDTTRFKNGEHVFSAKVYDMAGNIGVGTLLISIDND